MADKSVDGRFGEDAQPARPPQRAAAASKQNHTAKAAPRGDDAHQDGRNERDNQDQDRMLTDDERFAIFQASSGQSVLPNLPDMPGYHVCWLTTSNPRDTIAARIRMGYELVTPAMLSSPDEWTGASLKSGEYKNVIAVNEMIAARIRLSLYNRYMREIHDTMPRAEEEKLRLATMAAKEQMESVGSRIAEEGDGTADIVQRARPMPEFTS